MHLMEAQSQSLQMMVTVTTYEDKKAPAGDTEYLAYLRDGFSQALSIKESRIRPSPVTPILVETQLVGYGTQTHFWAAKRLKSGAFVRLHVSTTIPDGEKLQRMEEWIATLIAEDFRLKEQIIAMGDR